jgi:predicted transcriptional regulator of viral defense system
MRSTDAYGILTAAGLTDPVAIDQVAATLGISNREASDTAAAMVSLGLATRIRRGLVLLKRPAEIGTRTLGEDIHRAAITLAGPDRSYLAFYSALHHHGLVVQPPTSVFVATTRRLRSRVISGFTTHFVTVTTDRLFGIDDSTGLPWADAERTLVDGLARPVYCGQMPTVIAAFGRLGAGLDVDRLRSYARTYAVAALARRAEYILDRVGIAPATPPPRQRHYVLLDPAGPATGTKVPELELIDNVPKRVWHGA